MLFLLLINSEFCVIMILVYYVEWIFGYDIDDMYVKYVGENYMCL